MLESRNLKDMQRRMVKDFLDTVVLIKLRSGQWLGGYEIIELIQRKYSFIFSSGTIYALLYSLERKGLVRAGFAEGKRVYSLTEQGKCGIDAVIESKEEIARFVRSLLTVGECI